MPEFHLAEIERLKAGGDLARGSDDEPIQHASTVSDALDQVPLSGMQISAELVMSASDAESSRGDRHPYTFQSENCCLQTARCSQTYGSAGPSQAFAKARRRSAGTS